MRCPWESKDVKRIYVSSVPGEYVITVQIIASVQFVNDMVTTPMVSWSKRCGERGYCRLLARAERKATLLRSGLEMEKYYIEKHAAVIKKGCS